MRLNESSSPALKSMAKKGLYLHLVRRARAGKRRQEEKEEAWRQVAATPVRACTAPLRVGVILTILPYFFGASPQGLYEALPGR